MANLHYTIDIHAPKQKVWDVMLADATYRDWTSAFHPGSYYEGSWDKGSKIKFLAEDDGKLGGMTSRIVENMPYEYISIEHLGEIKDGKEDFTSEWSGAHENYSFSETSGVTTLRIELEGGEENPEMAAMFDQMWPKALARLKEIAESQ